MSTLQVLGIALAVSVVLSAILSAVLLRPLRLLLQRVCSGEEAVEFWTRFTIIMLFLSPALLSVAFGVPGVAPLTSVNPGLLVQQVLTTSLLGAFFAMLGIGLWVSALIRRAPYQAPPARAPFSAKETL